MSSGFISSGQLELTDTDKGHTSDKTHETSAVDAWAAADAAIKVAREKTTSSSGLIGSQDGGKSLYEVLQANKARKQEAFEEKLKFKNQFRSLDEGEVEFLDSVVSEQRAQEEAKKKEIESRLDDFRKLQYEVDHDPTSANNVPDESSNTWAVSVRRKRKKEKDTPAGPTVKLRKMSNGRKLDSAASDDVKTGTEDKRPVESSRVSKPVQKTIRETNTLDREHMIEKAPDSKLTPGLGGLVAYGSDSDDD